MIVLVVNMHACVTYSHMGSWYVMTKPEPSLPAKIPFLFWQAHLQAFFMGLLYFLAGAFAHRSLERHGPRRFLAERALRLGAPALFYMLVIHPFMVYVLLGVPQGADRPPLSVLYAQYLASGRVLSGNGPLWFTLALLVFSLVLMAWRALRPVPPTAAAQAGAAPGAVVLAAFGVVLVAATFLVRLVQPLGTNVLNFQLAYFSQYVAAFAAGVAAGRSGWLESLARSPRARVAGWLGLFGGPLLLAGVLFLGRTASDRGLEAYRGGWTVLALATAAWEQLTGLCLGLGLLALFRTRGNVGGRVARWLAERSFAVYVLHAPVLVAVYLLLQPFTLTPYAGAVLLTLLGLLVSFPLADAARRIPGLRAIL
jgi:peptidoglycan/LPS O-acetylase OafA/YrhL